MKRHLGAPWFGFGLLFFGWGAAAFGQAPGFFAGPRAYEGDDAAIADFNHDGILDLATIDQTSTIVHIQYGAGNGTFVGGESFNVASSIEGAANLSIVTGDLNGDGLPGLVVSQESIRVLLGTETGGFTNSANYSSE